MLMAQGVSKAKILFLRFGQIVSKVSKWNYITNYSFKKNWSLN